MFFSCIIILTNLNYNCLPNTNVIISKKCYVSINCALFNMTH